MLISSARRWVLLSCTVALGQLRLLSVLVSLRCIVGFGSAKAWLVSYRSQKPKLGTLWRNLTPNQTGRGLPTLTFEPVPNYTKECGPGSPLWHSCVLCGPADLFICEKRWNESRKKVNQWSGPEAFLAVNTPLCLKASAFPLSHPCATSLYREKDSDLWGLSLGLITCKYLDGYHCGIHWYIFNLDIVFLRFRFCFVFF